MITLTNPDQGLEVLLGGAAATTECPLVATYADSESGQRGLPTRKTVNGITTGATAVELVEGPRAGVSREIEHFSLFNADTTSVTVTIRLNDDGTTRILFKAAIVNGETLLYSPQRGFYVVDASGNVKTNAPGTSGDTSSADSKATSGATRASVADSKALSVSTLTSTADSKALSVGVLESSNKSVDDSRNTSVGTRFSIVESTANSG